MTVYKNNMNDAISAIFAAAKNANHETAAKAATERAYATLLAITVLRTIRGAK